MNRIRLLLVSVAALEACTAAVASSPTLELRPPEKRDCVTGRSTLQVAATEADGTIGTGEVKFTPDVGAVDSVSIGLDSYGTGRVGFTCDPFTNPACGADVKVTASWKGATKSVLVGLLQLACPRAAVPNDCSSCVDVASSLEGLRWSMPCRASQSNRGCWNDDPLPVSTTVGGVTGKTYSLALRFRGVVEQKTYTDGTNDGAFWQVGGTPAPDGLNIYALQISSPRQTFYLNRGNSSFDQSWAIDYTKTVQADAHATITLTATSIDGAEKKNVDAIGTPLLVAGVPPFPAAYDGQFIQMDVVSAR